MKYSFSITRLPFALLLALLAVAHSCKENPTAPTQPDPKRTIALATADSSLHEIWLRLSLPDSLSGRSIKLFRNDTLRYTFDLSNRDTVVMDSGLALGTRYTYRALRTDNTRTLDSAEATTATMPVPATPLCGELTRSAQVQLGSKMCVSSTILVFGSLDELTAINTTPPVLMDISGITSESSGPIKDKQVFQS